METWDALRARRDVRRYTDEALSKEQLERILEAGRRAPSASNWQPWDFVAVTERAALEELAKVWQGARHVATSAATIALIAETQDDPSRHLRLEYDLGQATIYIMLAATDLGVGSGHSGVEDQAQARQVLGFPQGRFCAHLIPLGYPADRPLRPIEHPNRRPFDDVVHWDRW
jgi:nitroreductase